MLQIIVFLSGAVLMALEMVGSRLLAPTFGSSIYVWGSLIVVVMAALTIGYYCGGRIADKFPNAALLGVILGLSGLFIGFLPFWTQRVNDSLGMLEPRAGSLLASLAFFFVPSVLLATVSPYGIKLTSRSLTTIGNTAGYMAAVSSAGSILGTLLTSFFLIPVMGVSNIVHMLGIILLALALLLFLIAWRRTAKGSGPRNGPSVPLILACLVILGGATLIGLWQSLPAHEDFGSDYKILYEHDSLYHHIKVVAVGTTRRLHFDESFQSETDLRDPLRMSFLYTSYLHLGVVAHPRPVRALFIGLGGGSAPKKFLHDYPSLKRVDAVEIDPAVAAVAKRYFQLPHDPRLHIIVQDGRLYVKKMARAIAAGQAAPYDLVIIDAYNASSIPYHLTTREFVQTVRQTLSRDGVVVSNIIGAIAGSSSPLLRSMTATLRTVFPQVYLFPVGGWSGPGDDQERNVIVVATIARQYWDGPAWRKQAEALHRSGTIAEDVPTFAQSLVPGNPVARKAWLKGIAVLTDDYAPVDTLKNPL